MDAGPGRSDGPVADGVAGDVAHAGATSVPDSSGYVSPANWAESALPQNVKWERNKKSIPHTHWTIAVGEEIPPWLNPIPHPSGQWIEDFLLPPSENRDVKIGHLFFDGAFLLWGAALLTGLILKRRTAPLAAVR